jgi:hypothetical protein
MAPLEVVVGSEDARQACCESRRARIQYFVRESILKVEVIQRINAEGWRAILNDALRETGGSVTNEERKWADALLHRPERRPERKKSTSSRGASKNRAA